jgi:radical SAM protein with 4Fe4S-binding SPASM domain
MTAVKTPEPFLISWNVTKRCNLKCAHCYLDSVELEGGGDISTKAAMKIVREVATLNPGAMLILTGGEPLLRPDIFDIAKKAARSGLTVVVGTNGTLIDAGSVKRLKASGVKGVGLSIDSATPEYHDRFRGMEGSWHKTLHAMRLVKKAGLDFQIQFTVTRENISDLPGVVKIAEAGGARVLNVFFLVCTGRGQEMTDLTPAEYESALEDIFNFQREYTGSLLIRARCAPHILRIASKIDPESPLLAGGTSGCIAGTGYLRITPVGEVTPCPYIPVRDESPSLFKTDLRTIWEKSPDFKLLRTRKYNGRCGECEYDEICGGCRARALATTGDLLGTDRWCVYEPGGGGGGGGAGSDRKILSGKFLKKKPPPPVWTPEAAERLNNVPPFLRAMIKAGVERYARTKGLKEITPEIMKMLKSRTGR